MKCGAAARSSVSLLEALPREKIRSRRTGVKEVLKFSF